MSDYVSGDSSVKIALYQTDWLSFKNVNLLYCLTERLVFFLDMFDLFFQVQ